MYGNVNAQVDSEVNDKTSLRILQSSINNKGIVDPELLERSFTINTLSGSPEYKHTALSKFQSNKYNKYLNNNGFPSIYYTDKDRDNFLKENSKRSMYNIITNNVLGNAYIAEEAHGYQDKQYKENLVITMAKY